MATIAELAELDLPYKDRKFYSVTLASGTGVIKTGFGLITHVNITQKAAVALAEQFAWTASGGSVTVDSSNASSTAVLTAEVIGTIGGV